MEPFNGVCEALQFIQRGVHVIDVVDGGNERENSGDDSTAIRVLRFVGDSDRPQEVHHKPVSRELQVRPKPGAFPPSFFFLTSHGAPKSRDRTLINNL